MGKWAVTVRSAASDREINDCFVYDDSDNYEGQTGEEGRILLDGGSPYIFRKRGFIEFSTAEFEDPPEENQKNVTVRLEQEAGVGDDVAGSDWEPSIHFSLRKIGAICLLRAMIFGFSLEGGGWINHLIGK